MKKRCLQLLRHKVDTSIIAQCNIAIITSQRRIFVLLYRAISQFLRHSVNICVIALAIKTCYFIFCTCNNSLFFIGPIFPILSTSYIKLLIGDDELIRPMNYQSFRCNYLFSKKFLTFQSNIFASKTHYFIFAFASINKIPLTTFDSFLFSVPIFSYFLFLFINVQFYTQRKF